MEKGKKKHFSFLDKRLWYGLSLREKKFLSFSSLGQDWLDLWITVKYILYWASLYLSEEMGF
jgi:hypothetical protein